MTIPFGPVPLGQACSPAGSASRVAANDNEAELSQSCLLHAALRHFAEHGLGAAELAQQRAEQAFFAGDSKEYRHWLDICRALDRRLADTVRLPRQAPR
jgi:hypothetical protein